MSRRIYPCPGGCDLLSARPLKVGCRECRRGMGIKGVAASAGIHWRAVKRMGGLEKLNAMSEEARALLIGMAKKRVSK